MLIDAIRQLFQGGNVNIYFIIAQLLSVIFIVILILPLHEYAHAWTANKLGDPTAKLEGRLTFNPLASVDPMGALFLLLFGFGWAKPVPVDSRYFKKPKRDMALTAIAGPLSNLLAALVGALLESAVIAFLPIQNSVVQFIFVFLQSYVMVNVSIAVFNLIPLPPLDGSRIIAAFLSDRALATYYRYQNVIQIAMVVLIFMGALSGPLSVVRGFLTNIIETIARFPFKIFGAL